MELLSPLSLGKGAVILSWAHLAASWSTPPALVGPATSPVPGQVYAYTLGDVTRYRLVPTSYSPAQDSFYAAHSNGECTGLVCSRG